MKNTRVIITSFICLFLAIILLIYSANISSYRLTDEYQFDHENKQSAEKALEDLFPDMQDFEDNSFDENYIPEENSSTNHSANNGQHESAPVLDEVTSEEANSQEEQVSQGSSISSESTEIAEHEEEKVPDSIYAKFPKSTNTSNFMSLDTITYDNVNGEDVTVDLLYRKRGEALNNPNVGQGIMVYQAIRYKLQYPEEDVQVTLSSFHFSVVAAVNVDRDSRYYGYMRSLYNSEYDEFGFVRICYLLVIAARVGIEVTVIGQINGSGVSQIEGWKEDYSFVAYFNSHLNDDCYDCVPAGKKVSDFMTFKESQWTSYGDRTGTDMQHIKLCTVSAYLDQDGNVGRYATWFGSVNIDGIDKNGSNGNNGDQTAIIISNHEEIYRASYNYARILSEYCAKEDIYEYRQLMINMNKEQIDLLYAGKAEQIPKDKQIVYLGTENDKIFKLYYTPLAGSIGEWDIRYNPFSLYMEKLLESTGYIEYAWNNVYYNTNFAFDTTYMTALFEAFNKNNNPKNKLYLYLPNLNTSLFNSFVAGVNIGKISINADLAYKHNKDIQLSYEANYLRHYVSIINTLPFSIGAMAYQTNSFVIIDETQYTGKNFYHALASRTTLGILS